MSTSRLPEKTLKRYLNSVLFFSLVLILNLFSANPASAVNTYQSDKTVSNAAKTTKTTEQRAQTVSFSDEETAYLLYRNRTLGKYNKKLERQNLEITRQAEKLKETEKQLLLATKMEAVGLMAVGVAHDLNNILSGIISYPEIILMKLPPASDLRKPVKAILDSGKRAAEVVADMLTVTRGIAAVRASRKRF